MQFPVQILAGNSLHLGLLQALHSAHSENTQQLRYGDRTFAARGTSRVELSSGPAAQSTHHLQTVQTTAKGHLSFGKHEHCGL